MTQFSPRSSQSRILAYQGGHMGISAVPGAGKTHTLSALAADLIARGGLADDQEVLIVTLVNSAVDNFANRIGSFIQSQGLIPRLGYRIRTLHGLSHDIVREKPSRVGLEEQFKIVDEQEANRIRSDAVHAWLTVNPNGLDEYLDPMLETGRRDWIIRERLPELLESLALAFIRSAKDHRQTPEALSSALQKQQSRYPLVEAGLAIYSDYQRALHYRGAVDFDDLIRLALELLVVDSEYLERLRYRFPFVLEDEAQDSSKLQEQILELLSGPGGNWVRVGDPNQAIFETFTTASPELLKQFIRANPHVDMTESGRSQPAIIALANELIDWCISKHPVPDLRSALSLPHIQPTGSGDPQQNPPDDPAAVQFISRKLSPQEEVNFVVDSVSAWLPHHADWTLAVLVPRNQRGVEVIDALKKKGIPTVELLSSTASTRQAAGALHHVLAFLSDPQSTPRLVKAYQVYRREWRHDPGMLPMYQHVIGLLKKCRHLESYLAPAPDRDWISVLDTSEDQDFPGTKSELERFKAVVRRWLEAVTLPIDQLILTLGAEIFTNPTDLALTQKLALLTRQQADDHQDWRLPEQVSELGTIAKNERKFIGFSSDDTGFDPSQYRGRVVVTTMHKAKGLEWDRVYLMSLNNYDFPSNQPNDQYISEKTFIREELNLEAEALEQMRMVLSSGEYNEYEQGAASYRARVDYSRERLRLLYVGLTRARRDVILTWNTGRKGEAGPTLGFSALHAAFSPSIRSGESEDTSEGR